MSNNPALRAALTVAYRHFGDRETTDAERDAILASMAEHFRGAEGELAARALHHRRESAALQLELKGLITPPLRPLNLGRA